MFRAFAQFKQQEGHCDVSKQHIEHALDGAVNDKLGAWLMNQSLHQGCGTLDAKREKGLESLGVMWNCKQQEIAEECFDSNFDLLLAFKEREGHVQVPIRHQESDTGDNLGTWLVNQRFIHRHGVSNWIGKVARGSRCHVGTVRDFLFVSNVSSQHLAGGRKRSTVIHFC
jgi:hypothetical protein